MALAHFRMLIHEMLNKDPEMVPKEAPWIVLYSKSSICMAKSGKDTKHTKDIARRIYFLRNGEKYKMHNIYWCEGCLQLAGIVTKNVSEPDITPRMIYVLVRLENWYRTIEEEGWHNTKIFYGTRVLYDSTRLRIGIGSISLECSKDRKTMLFWMKTVLTENHV